MGIKNLVFVMTALFGLAACAPGHCRRQSDKPAEAKPLEGAPDAAAAAKPSAEDRVFVYKYDGSMQCGMGKPVALESMAKELKEIPIVSSAKKPDGLMHIQVCGSPSGTANVYEIPAKFQKQAEAKGFKKWSFE